MREGGVSEPTLKVNIPVASGEAPVSMPACTVLLTAPEDGRPSENGRAGAVNVSESLSAVRDCSIDFSAQLFARGAFLSSPE